MRKFFQLLFLPFLAALLCLRSAAAMPYIVVDVQGHVLAQQDAFDRWYPASLTKMMTAYVTFQALEAGKIKLDTPISLSESAAKVVPSKSGWRPGTKLTLDTALTVMLVKSANDMANAIAEAVGGSQSAFVDMMNAQAQRLGMTGTHFANPNGLPDEQNYTDARDMSVLAVQIRRDFPQYAHYFDIPAIDSGKGKKPQPNSNNLIGRYDGADGMKTGFICGSGFNLTASATRNGRTVIAVVLGAERIDIRETTAAKLLTQGFKNMGSPRLTLASLRPYGDKQDVATNMHDAICNAQAGRIRMQYRDEQGHPILDSPFITALNPTPEAVEVRPLYEPPAPPKAQKPRKKAAHKVTGKGKAAAVKKTGDSAAAGTAPKRKAGSAKTGANANPSSAAPAAAPKPSQPSEPNIPANQTWRGAFPQPM